MEGVTLQPGLLTSSQPGSVGLSSAIAGKNGR
jgi:hypothetical protein